MKRSAVYGGAILLFLVAFYVALQVDRFVGGLADRSPLAGVPTAWSFPGQQRAPDANALFATTLGDLASRQQALSQWKGKVLVVNFWATWCPPCRQEIPVFEGAMRRHAGQGLEIVGIALDGKDRVGPFARDAHIHYPVLLGGSRGAALAAALGNGAGAIPYTVIVAPEGRLVQTHAGAYTRAQLETAIASLLAQ
jgi:thiol-disulfide isomerase/thioredoxin